MPMCFRSIQGGFAAEQRAPLQYLVGLLIFNELHHKMTPFMFYCNFWLDCFCKIWLGVFSCLYLQTMAKDIVQIELCWSEYIPIEKSGLYDLSGIGIYEFVHLFPDAVKPSLLYVGQTANCFRARILWDKNYTPALSRDLATHFRIAEIKANNYRLDELSYNVKRALLLKIETDIINTNEPAYNKRTSEIELPFELNYSVSNHYLELKPYPYKYAKRNENPL